MIAVEVDHLLTGGDNRTNQAATSGIRSGNPYSQSVMDSHLTATEAARSFSEILKRVQSEGDTFVVERGGQPVCRIVPVGPAHCTMSDLRKLLEGAPRPDAEFLDEVDELTRTQPTLPAGPWEP